MINETPKPRKEDFESRLREARNRLEEQSLDKPAEPSAGRMNAGMALGFRIATELVAAVAVGAGIGLLLDYWLETRPWFLIVFVLLGAVAGMMNVYRLATGQKGVVGYDNPPESDESGKGNDRERQG